MLIHVFIHSFIFISIFILIRYSYFIYIYTVYPGRARVATATSTWRPCLGKCWARGRWIMHHVFFGFQLIVLFLCQRNLYVYMYVFISGMMIQQDIVQF